MRTQIEVQNQHLTVQKQQVEQLKGELSTSRQALAEVSQADLAKKTLLLSTELEQMRSENQSQAQELLQLREAIK